MSVVRDPFLDVPLQGVQLVEASAGTGKTFTLATLFLRLVVERGLRVGAILAVTYTEAATQELRKRIRERLQLALELFDAPETDAESAAAKLTRALLRAQRERGVESDDALKRRLRQATLEVSVNTAEQRKGGELVVGAAERITRIAKENLASAEEIAESAGRLVHNADVLKQKIGIFKVD